MSEPNTILSNANLPTIVAVTFVLALLAVAFNFYAFNRMGVVAGMLSTADAANRQEIESQLEAIDDRLEAIEKRLDAFQEPPAPE